jgi:hypothetical protein
MNFIFLHTYTHTHTLSNPRYQSSGDLTSAREHLESSLKISKKVYGDQSKHPGVGKTLLGLSELDIKEGRTKDAAWRKKAAQKILNVMWKDRRGTFKVAEKSDEETKPKTTRKTQMRWNLLRKSVKNKNTGLSVSARNLLTLATDEGLDGDDDPPPVQKSGVVVEMKQMGRCNSEVAVLDI